MAFWDRFKRKQQVILPEEVNQYYQSQRKERVGIAIVLGIVALIVTLLIASALFFGGRFAYRKITSADKKDAPSTQQEQTGDTNEPDDTTAGQGDVEETPTTPPQPTTPTQPSTQTPAPTTPALGDEALPRTGDEGM